MKNSLNFGIDFAVIYLAAIATLITLHPGITGIAAIAMLAFGISQAVLHGNVTKNLLVIIVVAVLALAGVELGISPGLAAVAIVVAARAFSTSKPDTLDWVAPWVAAVALCHIPPVVNMMLAISDIGPEWAGVAIHPITFITFSVIFGIFQLKFGVLAISAVLAISLFLYQLEITPSLLAMAAALPAATSTLLANRRKISYGLIKRDWVIGLPFALGILVSLAILVPAIRLPGEIAVWIPEEKNSVSKYFDQYESVLKASGFKSTRIINSIGSVQPGDWVFFPSAAHPALASQLNELKTLPHYASLIIVVVGEHTDYDGVASSINTSGSPIGLNVDTTIPLGNSDLLGWASGMGSVPSRSATINRGASISYKTWDSIPLLWIQGGHREEDRYDDGRIGDMVFRRGDRAGMYSVLALGHETSGPVWIMLGDSTPALNEYLVVAPNELAKILALGTGLPALIGLLAWAALYTTTVLNSRNISRLCLVISLLLLAATMSSTHLLAAAIRDESASRVVISNRSPYGDQAVGRALVVLSKTLIEENTNIEVGKISTESTEKLISIGHRRDWIGRLDCVRAGNIDINTIRILDVIACPENFHDPILMIGKDVLAHRDGLQLIVFDQHFISNSAPPENVEWLKKIILEMRR